MPAAGDSVLDVPFIVRRLTSDAAAFLELAIRLGLPLRQWGSGPLCRCWRGGFTPPAYINCLVQSQLPVRQGKGECGIGPPQSRTR